MITYKIIKTNIPYQFYYIIVYVIMYDGYNNVSIFVYKSIYKYYGIFLDNDIYIYIYIYIIYIILIQIIYII